MSNQQNCFADEIRRIPCRTADDHQFRAVGRRIRRNVWGSMTMPSWPAIVQRLRRAFHKEKNARRWETDYMYQ